MFAKCCICGAGEETPLETDGPVVCDRPDCEAKAREMGWSLLLSQFIETKRRDDGVMMFRLRPPE